MMWEVKWEDLQMPVERKVISRFASLLTLVLGAGIGLVTAAPAGAAPSTLYVATGGSDSNPCSKQAPCATITHAVSIAVAGNSIIVGKGTYTEDVSITKRLKVFGKNQPIVNASGRANGFLIQGAGAAGSTVQGFTVENATFEGILAQQTRNLTINDNHVVSNDRGIFLPANQQTGECAGNGPVPGDCGEGLHLMSVTNSHIRYNTVTGNSGGILLSDEFGPTAHNEVGWNHVDNNVYDCGITVVGHMPSVVKNGQPQPSVGGVYDNTIIGNEVNGNGVQGKGGGILLAVSAPGGASYDNRIVNNTAEGNGLAGVTIHLHIPGQDVNGNVIENNLVKHDALDGYGPGQPGDNDTSDTQTTGILVFGAAPITGTIIRDNDIRDVHFGIWTQDVPTISPSDNSFSGVAVKVHQQ